MPRVIRHTGRPRLQHGVFHELIAKVTPHNTVKEFAAILGCTPNAVYKWDRGKKPNLFYQGEINRLCVAVGMKLIYGARKMHYQGQLPFQKYNHIKPA